MPFTCSICDEPSTQICVSCTKDTCANHLCVKCHRCSDCCECEAPLVEGSVLPDPGTPSVTAPPAHAEVPPVVAAPRTTGPTVIPPEEAASPAQSEPTASEAPEAVPQPGPGSDS